MRAEPRLRPQPQRRPRALVSNRGGTPETRGRRRSTRPGARESASSARSLSDEKGGVGRVAALVDLDLQIGVARLERCHQTVERRCFLACEDREKALAAREDAV